MTINESKMQDEPPVSLEVLWKAATQLGKHTERQHFSNKGLYNILAYSTNLAEEQAAISAIQKSDQTNFQEISASKLTLSNSFYNNTLRQSQQSFLWSLIWAGVGAAFIIVTVVLVIVLRPTIANSVIIGLLGGAGGIGSETIAYATLKLYQRASDQAAACHIRLDRASDFILANSACEGLSSSEKEQMRSEIIRKLVE